MTYEWLFLMIQFKQFIKHTSNEVSGLNQTHLLCESFRAFTEFSTDSFTELWTIFQLCLIENEHRAITVMCTIRFVRLNIRLNVT